MTTAPAASLDLGPVFDAAGQEWNVDPNLLRAVAGQESGGTANPDFALSPKGAQGRMQIMPATGQAMGMTDPSDPVQSIYAGAKFLSQQLDKYGTPELALAAYNAGPGRVDDYLAGKATLPNETQNYVPGIAQKHQAITARQRGNGNTSAVANPYQSTAAVLPDPTASTPGAAAAMSLAVPVSYTQPAPSQLGQTSPGGGSTDPNAVPPIPSAQAGNNMPLVSTGYGPGGFGNAPRVVLGDSLGVGMMQSGNLPGIAQGSMPPGVVRDRINALPDGALGGKQVVISTGLSNSGTPQQRQADLAVVQQQVDAARAKGAASVVLAGVGDARFPGINAGIADIATRNNAAFTGPAPVADAAGVHPRPNGYRAMLAAAPGVPQAASDGGATQRLQATLAGFRQPAAPDPAASPAPAASPIVQAAYDPFSQAMTAAQAATAAPSAPAQAARQTPFDRAMAAAQAATRAPAAAPAAPATPGSPATPASAAPSPQNGAPAPSGAPVAQDAFSQALQAAQRASAASAIPTAPGSPPPPAQGAPAATQGATPPAASPVQPQAGTGILGDVLNAVPAIGNAFDAASRKLYGVTDALDTAVPILGTVDHYLGINPAAAIPNLDARIAAYDRSEIGSTPGGMVGNLVGQTAIAAPVLGGLGGPLAAIGGRMAGAADAVAPELGAALRYGGRLVSGTASSDNKLINAVVRPASLAADGAAQGAVVNTVTGDPNASPYQNALTGAAVGGVLGPAAAGVMKGVGAGYNALTGLIRPFTVAGQGAIAD